MKAIPIETYNLLMHQSSSSQKETPQNEPSNLYNFENIQVGDGFFESPSFQGTGKPKQESTIINFLPVNQRTKGQQILQLLTQSNRVKWNELGEISIDGKRILSSNIVDLLSVSTKHGKLRQINTPGIKEFLILLKDLNLPKHLFGNEFVKLIESNELPNCRGWVRFEECPLTQ